MIELGRKHADVSKRLREGYIVFFYDLKTKVGKAISCEYALFLTHDTTSFARQMEALLPDAMSQIDSVLETLVELEGKAAVISLWERLYGWSLGAAMVRKADVAWAERVLECQPGNFIRDYRRLIRKRRGLVPDEGPANVGVA